MMIPVNVLEYGGHSMDIATNTVIAKPSINQRTAMAIVDAAVNKAMELGVPRLTLIGGGVPITVDNTVVGAIGVSGGTVDQDIECAHAALRALEPAAS
jgi:uncharacterized protein GlcG (DUF336 family)